MSTEVSATTAAATRSELPDIHLAAQIGNLEKLKELVSRENVNNPAEDGSFALHWAASGNHWEATKYLLSMGADPNLKGAMDATALHWATRNGLIYMTRLLIEAGADPAASDSQKYTALHVAVHSSNVLMVIYLLHLAQPTDPNSRDASDRTPLHWAAYQGDHLSLKSLIRAGADPNLQDAEGFSPLHWSLVSRNPSCIQLLIEAKSDLTLRTNEGKSCWDIAEEMNSMHEWHHALFTDDRRPESGIKVPRLIKPLFAKLVLFSLPFMLCPVFIHIIMMGKIGFPIALVLAFILHRICLRYFYPVLDRTQHAILKSPALAGIYNGMFAWALIVYFYYVLPAVWRDFIVLSTVGTTIMAFILVCYIATVVMDPGTILAGSIGERRDNISSLLDHGVYDSTHFCVHTWAVKPARSQYSRVSNSVIARFDHYCPWAYNCVGLRNHRVFMLYVLFLGLDIWVYAYLYLQYLATLDPTFWEAVYKTQFSALLMVGILFQGAWINLLAFTQLVQVARGMTTAEFGHGHYSESFGSLPQDHPFASKVVAPEYDGENPAPARQHGNCFVTCSKVLGVHQAMVTSRSRNRRRNNGYSVRTNCGDFWCTGFNLFTPEGMGRLNGQAVDYYTLRDTPGGIQGNQAAPSGSDAENALRRIV